MVTLFLSQIKISLIHRRHSYLTIYITKQRILFLKILGKLNSEY